MDLDAERGTVGVRTMKASEFKAKCLKLMDEVAETGEEIHITKRGRAVAKLTPLKRRPKTLFGMGRGRMEILGDLDEPLGIVWEAEKGLLDGK
ncbi:MAG: type II toxin-antitoxin system prevent-host-death family antitoxin [Chloroflexi bacterium]|nr:type II toxin-antitoxin system prevent-host-death family antitoxin [Chloroflexota bacterium]